MRTLGLALALATFLLPAAARADRLDTLSQRLASSSSYKVRISAALSLAKLHDERALLALAKALEHDRAATVRRVAAATLARQVSPRTSANTRARAQRTLERAAAGDSDPKVRSSAKVALKVLHGQPTQRTTRGVWVGIGKTAVAKQVPSSMSSGLEESLERTIRKHAPTFITSRGTKLPTNVQLHRSGRAGYLVAPRVSELRVHKRGRQTEVQCTVNLRLAPWNGRDGGERWGAGNTATVKGSARVTTGSSRKDLAEATQNCVDAVVEQVTRTKVVPFLAQAR